MKDKCVFLFLMPMSKLFRYDSVCMRSADSMCLFRIEGLDKFVVVDSRFSDDELVTRVCGVLGAERLCVTPESSGSRYFGSYLMSMVKAAIVKLNDNGIEPRSVLSVPACWKCVSQISVSSAVRIATFRGDVFSVFLGGCPVTHLDRSRTFDLVRSPVPGYLKLRTLSWDYPGLDRIMCPSVINVEVFNSVCSRPKNDLNAISSCGWNNSAMVLYPDILSVSPKDGKPEPFKDILGISPVFWDVYKEVDTDA